MSVFTDNELEYLAQTAPGPDRNGRAAGTAAVVPTSFRYKALTPVT